VPKLLDKSRSSAAFLHPEFGISSQKKQDAQNPNAGYLERKPNSVLRKSAPSYYAELQFYYNTAGMIAPDFSVTKQQNRWGWKAPLEII